MFRIDTRVPDERWQFACPTPERHRNWRVTDGHFECRSCNTAYESLIHLESGEKVPRDEIEFVGPHTDHQIGFGRSPGD